MDKKDKILLIIMSGLYIIVFMSKVSVILNNYSIEPIDHHSLGDVQKCAEKVLKEAKMYDEAANINCECSIYRKTTYYKYTCNCKIKDNAGKILQGGGSRILYEEKNSYKLKYNFWINENKWYTGYCGE